MQKLFERVKRFLSRADAIESEYQFFTRERYDHDVRFLANFMRRHGMQEYAVRLEAIPYTETDHFKALLEEIPCVFCQDTMQQTLDVMAGIRFGRVLPVVRW